MPLYDILNEFQKGHSHIAVVYKDLNEKKEISNKGKGAEQLEFKDSCKKHRGKSEALPNKGEDVRSTNQRILSIFYPIVVLATGLPCRLFWLLRIRAWIFTLHLICILSCQWLCKTCICWWACPTCHMWLHNSRTFSPYIVPNFSCPNILLNFSMIMMSPPYLQFRYLIGSQHIWIMKLLW